MPKSVTAVAAQALENKETTSDITNRVGLVFFLILETGCRDTLLFKHRFYTVRCSEQVRDNKIRRRSWWKILGTEVFNVFK